VFDQLVAQWAASMAAVVNTANADLVVPQYQGHKLQA
jgi:hypothetical protein